MDLGFVGAEGFIIANLTRWNEATYERLCNYPDYANDAAFPRGSWSIDDVGALQLNEELALTVWVMFPYSATAGKQAYSTMPGGYRFPATMPYGPEDMNQLGTQARRLGLLFHALPAYQASAGKFVLYDNNMGSVTTISTV